MDFSGLPPDQRPTDTASRDGLKGMPGLGVLAGASLLGAFGWRFADRRLTFAVDQPDAFDWISVSLAFFVSVFLAALVGAVAGLLCDAVFLSRRGRPLLFGQGVAIAVFGLAAVTSGFVLVFPVAVYFGGAFAGVLGIAVPALTVAAALLVGCRIPSPSHARRDSGDRRPT